ncbi:GNAT family N-acetyltransferase [Pikeienuella piscinae]|uniref:GNAT family N-acetyltransferase n=1 Tax=Pikeienuella piscinae TaxID=2748098 RepID=A0A7L5BXE9_9RHOB|nr:GNAT family N-acetyltransferase [Pikeienuella piscinae]QIE56402.1 GNAT family N-acetyltransferase [Pikeienuella piscinae]
MRLETGRLILRPFEANDHAPFAELNADPEVMAHFPAPLGRAESDDLIATIRERTLAHGFGFAAIAEEGGGFLGMCGLNRPGFAAHFTPCVEIGWRLRRAAWGRGFASEAARAWLTYGFTTLELDEIVAFTTTGNHRSMAVMERIGMVRERVGGFMHPALKRESPLAPHVLYRLARRDHDT